MKYRICILLAVLLIWPVSLLARTLSAACSA